MNSNSAFIIPPTSLFVGELALTSFGKLTITILIFNFATFCLKGQSCRFLLDDTDKKNDSHFYLSTAGNTEDIFGTTRIIVDLPINISNSNIEDCGSCPPPIISYSPACAQDYIEFFGVWNSDELVNEINCRQAVFSPDRVPSLYLELNPSRIPDIRNISGPCSLNICNDRIANRPDDFGALLAGISITLRLPGVIGAVTTVNLYIYEPKLEFTPLSASFPATINTCEEFPNSPNTQFTLSNSLHSPTGNPSCTYTWSINDNFFEDAHMDSTNLPQSQILGIPKVNEVGDYSGIEVSVTEECNIPGGCSSSIARTASIIVPDPSTSTNTDISIVQNCPDLDITASLPSPNRVTCAEYSINTNDVHFTILNQQRDCEYEWEINDFFTGAQIEVSSGSSNGIQSRITGIPPAGEEGAYPNVSITAIETCSGEEIRRITREFSIVLGDGCTSDPPIITPSTASHPDATECKSYRGPVFTVSNFIPGDTYIWEISAGGGQLRRLNFSLVPSDGGRTVRLNSSQVGLVPAAGTTVNFRIRVTHDNSIQSAQTGLMTIRINDDLKSTCLRIDPPGRRWPPVRISGDFGIPFPINPNEPFNRFGPTPGPLPGPFPRPFPLPEPYPILPAVNIEFPIGPGPWGPRCLTCPPDFFTTVINIYGNLNRDNPWIYSFETKVQYTVPVAKGNFIPYAEIGPALYTDQGQGARRANVGFTSGLGLKYNVNQRLQIAGGLDFQRTSIINANGSNIFVPDVGVLFDLSNPELDEKL